MDATNKGITRRHVVIGAGALLAAGLWPGKSECVEADNFDFICINDLHCMDKECGDWLERNVVRQYLESKRQADFCLLLGDLAETGTAQELSMVREVFRGLRIPVFTVLGNHDYVSQVDRKAYIDIFGNDLNFLFEHKGWQFVGLDTTQGVGWTDTTIQSDTFAWIRKKVKTLDGLKPTVIFTHFPMGPDVTFRPRNADDALQLFSRHNLCDVLSGHFHGRTVRKLNDTTLTTNQCCALKRVNHDGTLEKGYFHCHASNGEIIREFVMAGN